MPLNPKEPILRKSSYNVGNTKDVRHYLPGDFAAVLLYKP